MNHQAQAASLRSLSISLFGQFEARLDSQAVGGFEYNKVRALLAYLVMEREQPHSRGSLCALLWPDLPESAARQNLSQALTRLRQALGDKQAATPFLLTTTDTVQLNPQSLCRVDVIGFTTIITDAERHAHRAWHLCALCASNLSAAVAAYKGDFLAQFYVSDSDVFEEWALLLRQRLRQRMLSALERLIRYAEWHGDAVQAALYAQRQVELEPLRDDGHREVMRLLALSGQQTAALTQYEYLHQTLRAELDAEPEPETTTLYEQIRLGGRLDGLRRLQPPSSQLPTPPTPLVGREAEVQAILQLLGSAAAQPAVRLLTLTGAPGIGKTRLALEAAQRLRFDWEDGVHWVELAPVLDAAHVVATLAAVLGVKEQAHQPLAEAVAEHLRAKHCLLVFDNFEQVLDAAPLVGTLLAQCPALSVLVTSRAPLHLRAEYLFSLEPLALPAEGAALDTVAEAEAVQLFQSRARAVRPDFALTPDNAAAVAAICRRLDGLPLAIELIATRLKSLDVKEILEQWESRLSAVAPGPRDMPARHRTLRQAIDWSYDRLNPDEQAAFAYLGVFTGGCTAEAAQAVTGDALPVLPILEALHDASLLYTQASANTTRFSMLETVSEFALERLTASSVLPRAKQRHIDYFAQMADQAYTELLGPNQPRWSARIAAEQDNLRAALRWAMSNDDIEAALRIATGIWRFWWQRGFLREGLTWLDAALARRDEAAPAVQTKALRAAGVLASTLNHYVQARHYLEQALEVAERIGATYDAAAATTNLGLALSEQGDFAAASSFLEQGIALNRQTTDTRSVKFPMIILASLCVRMGQFERAGTLYEECLRLNRELADSEGTANALYGIATVAKTRGEYHRAQQWCEQSLALYASLNHQFGVGWCYHVLGDIARTQADYAEALAHYQHCLTVWLHREDHVNDARVLDDMAKVWHQLGKSARAVQLLGAAQAIREGADAKLTDFEQADYEAVLAACRAALTEAAYRDAWMRGHTLQPEQAVALALRAEPSDALHPLRNGGQRDEVPQMDAVIHSG